MTVIQDWGTAIISALANALNLILAFIPRLIGFAVILLVGWLIASLVSKGLTALLRKVGFDRLGQRIGLQRIEQSLGIRTDAAGVLGRIVYWFIFLIFLVSAADALGLPAVSQVLNSIVTFLPNVFVAILVLFLGSLLATFVADIVYGATSSTSVGNPRLLAAIARYTIIGFAALIALEQLNIAPTLLNELFGAIVAGAALAFGLAFGLGGRDAAQRVLSRAGDSLSTVASQVNTTPRTPQPAAPAQTNLYQQQQANPYQQDAPVQANQYPPQTNQYQQSVPTQTNAYPPANATQADQVTQQQQAPYPSQE